MQRSIDYIEAHLAEPIDYAEVAAQSYASSYHFQRVFSILCGYTLGEYIRNRRLSLAGAELAAGGAKVIDVALKYGYESPDSFAKAFQKFHGILPSQARSNGSRLRSFSRLVVKLSLEGGSMMEYRIEKRPEMTFIGYHRRFSGTPAVRTEQTHEFYVSTRANQYLLKGIEYTIRRAWIATAPCITTSSAPAVTTDTILPLRCHSGKAAFKIWKKTWARPQSALKRSSSRKARI